MLKCRILLSTCLNFMKKKYTFVLKKNQSNLEEEKLHRKIL